MLKKRYESPEVDRRDWLHVPSKALLLQRHSPNSPKILLLYKITDNQVTVLVSYVLIYINIFPNWTSILRPIVVHEGLEQNTTQSSFCASN